MQKNGGAFALRAENERRVVLQNTRLRNHLMRDRRRELQPAVRGKRAAVCASVICAEPRMLGRRLAAAVRRH